MGNSNPSKQCKPSDLAWQRDEWLRMHRPMCTRELVAVIGDWKNALLDVNYLKVVNAGKGFSADHLIIIKCKAKIQPGYAEMAQADLAKIWAGDVSVGMIAVHTFEKRTNGFEMQFAGVNELKSALSGQIIVELAA